MKKQREIEQRVEASRAHSIAAQAITLPEMVNFSTHAQEPTAQATILPEMVNFSIQTQEPTAQATTLPEMVNFSIHAQELTAQATTPPEMVNFSTQAEANIASTSQYRSTSNPDPETTQLIEPPTGMDPQALENLASIDQNLEATQALFESDQDRMKEERLETLRLGHRAALDSFQELHIPDRLRDRPMTTLLNNHSPDLFGPGPPVSRGEINGGEKGGMEQEETDREIAEQGVDRREELSVYIIIWIGH